ncbi:MAG: TonB-dependent receptor [Deltaproteobacteria bacterium]|nr:TonB-dependent receptor [Deltaproteobacteria bacterium]
MTWGVGDASAQAEATEAPEAAAAADTVQIPIEDEHKALEEIVVTADRRESNIQDVAASVSAFNEQDLLAQGLLNVNDVQFNVPSFFSGSGLTRVTARGIGSEIVGPGVDPGFAVHVNGVFSSREATGLLDFLDIERVEILRGPQGTRYGRNSTGGAINVITMLGQNDFDVYGDIQYANYRDLLARVVLNTPIIEEKLLFRIAALTRFSEGYMQIKSPRVDQHLNDSGSVGLRATLSWLPTDDFRLDVIGGLVDANRNGSGRKFLGPYFNGLDDGFGPGAGLAPGADYTGALPNPIDPNKGTENELQNEQSHGYGLTIIGTWDQDYFRLQSTTGYQSTRFLLHRGNDTSSLHMSTLDLFDRSWQVSEEILVSDPGGNPYTWMAGANYQYDKTPVTRLWTPNFQDTAVSVNYDILESVFPFSNVSPVGEVYETFTNLETEVGSHIFGIFASGDYTFFDRLTVGGGVRYSYTDRDWNDTSKLQSYIPATFAPPPAPPVPGLAFAVTLEGTRQEKSWDGVTGEASIRYDILDDSNVYASYAHGERFGGFQFLEVGPFASEEVDAIEVGTKNRFWDDRIQLNLAGFYYDYNNPQITQVVGGTPVTDNAPSARSYGVEAEFDVLVTDDILINGTFGWLDARYDEDFCTQDTTLPSSAQECVVGGAVVESGTQNINGNQLNRSPRFTASFGAQYTWDLGSRGELVPRFDFYFRDVITFRQYGNPLDEADRYTRTDLRLTWTSPDRHFWVQAFVQNVEGNNVKVGQETLSSIYRVHYYDTPRNGGVRVGYSFN